MDIEIGGDELGNEYHYEYTRNGSILCYNGRDGKEVDIEIDADKKISGINIGRLYYVFQYNEGRQLVNIEIYNGHIDAIIPIK
jgi:hypothetical protein